MTWIVYPIAATPNPSRPDATHDGNLHNNQKAATVTVFVERALAFYARHGITAKRVMTGNAFTYVMNRSLGELLASHDITHLKNEALPAPHQRQGRTLPPDHGPRMGLRPRLPLTSTPRPSAATLARPLQPAATAQLVRRPTDHRSAAFITCPGRTPRPADAWSAGSSAANASDPAGLHGEATRRRTCSATSKSAGRRLDAETEIDPVAEIDHPWGDDRRSAAPLLGYDRAMADRRRSRPAATSPSPSGCSAASRSPAPGSAGLTRQEAAEPVTRCVRNQSRASAATRSSAPLSSNRCVARGTIATS